MQVVSTSTLCKNLLNVKNIMIEDVKLWDGQKMQFAISQSMLSHTRKIKIVALFAEQSARATTLAASADLGEPLILVASSYSIVADTSRIECPHHGVHVASVPWAYPGSLTKEFETSTAWLATQLNKSAVAKYMRISWDTVGKIISRRVREDIEPNLKSRLMG